LTRLEQCTILITSPVTHTSSNVAFAKSALISSAIVNSMGAAMEKLDVFIIIIIIIIFVFQISGCQTFGFAVSSEIVSES